MKLFRGQGSTSRLITLCSFGGILAALPAMAGTIGATAATPTSVATGMAATVTVTSVITDPTVIPASVQLQSLGANGTVTSIVGTLNDTGVNGDVKAGDGIYTIQTTVLQDKPGTLTYRVSAGFKGSLLRVFSNPVTVTVTGTSVAINILVPANLLYTNTSPVNVTGTVGDPSATVKINGISAPVTGGQFLATVPLVEGLNTLTAVATNTAEIVTTASVQVTLDTAPPHITIDSPQAGTTTTASTLTVTGTANDVVVGTVNSGDVQVTVNGIPAQVANRTFSAPNVPLALGANTIKAVGVDRAGNGTTVSAVITRQSSSQPLMPLIGKPVVMDSLNLISGNNQTGTIGTAVGSPLVVALTDQNGKAVAGQPVVFTVTGNNGTLTGGGKTSPSVTVDTDSSGHAQAAWTLGQHSGAGIDTVQAASSLAVGAVGFTATSLTSGPTAIVVDSGNNQTGAIGQPLAFPFVAVVTDSGHNRVPNVAVTFNVTQGGGTLNGALSQQVMSDDNGRAIVVLSLGDQPGNDNNVVQASFAGNTSLPVTFSASGLAPGNPANTSISGVVLDNSNNPIKGVTMRLYLTNQGSNNNLPMQIGTPVQTNAAGMFLISPVPVGYFKLMADGSTAVSSSSYPTLEYDIVTVAGQNNTVGTPIYLPALDTVNHLCVNNSVGGTFTSPLLPGFSLTVAPGSATFPGGSTTGCISVSAVHSDKVPMAPGFGQQPRFIVSIQPVGTVFNPPAPMTIPNVDGLAPGAVTEMYSYDHDLSMFVAIGTGTVSKDGSVIASNPGVGVLKAGWHCGGDPNTAGTVADCPTCQICDGTNCVADPMQNGNSCSSVPPGYTGVCVNGTCAGFEGVLTARDNFTGRSTTSFGVGEIIDLSAMTVSASAAGFGGLQWVLISGGGTVTGGVDGTGTYTAPGSPATVVLRIQIASGPGAGMGQNYTISVIAPSSAHMVKDSNLRHTMGLAGVGFLGNIFLAPTNVSFANISFGEGTVPAVASGFYANFSGLAHPQDTFGGVGGCNVTTGCLVNPHDMVDSGDKGPPFSVGDFVWAIPWQYWVGGAARTTFTTATHHMFTDATGKASIEKAGAGPFSKNAADATSTY